MANVKIEYCPCCGDPGVVVTVHAPVARTAVAEPCVDCDHCGYVPLNERAPERPGCPITGGNMLC